MRYIDADKLIQRFRPFTDVFGTKMVHIDSVVHVIKNEPTADVVEVVRCKDCKWYHGIGCAINIVDESDEPKDNDYCSFGERADT